MIPTCGIDILHKRHAEKRDLYRDSIAQEETPDEEHVIGGAESRAAKLNRLLSFGYMGRQGNELPADWIELSTDQIEQQRSGGAGYSEGAGWYVLVDGPWEGRSEKTACLRARVRDLNERSSGGSDRDAEGEERRLRREIAEEARMSLGQAKLDKITAEGKVAGLESTIDGLRDERRANKDRIAELESQIRDGGGTVRVIMETVVPFVGQIVALLQAKDERDAQTLAAGKRKDQLAEKSARALELFAEFVGAVGEELPSASKNARLKRLAARMSDELDDGSDEEPEAPPAPELPPVPPPKATAKAQPPAGVKPQPSPPAPPAGKTDEELNTERAIAWANRVNGAEIGSLTDDDVGDDLVELDPQDRAVLAEISREKIRIAAEAMEMQRAEAQARIDAANQTRKDGE